jgi:hypothetical protein
MPDLDAIRTRTIAATQGPWAIYLDPMAEDVVYQVSSGPATEGYNLNGGDFDTAKGMTETNADFIANAREDIVTVLDALAAVTAERNQARADLIKETDHCRDTARALRQITARWDQARQMLADAPHEGWCPQFHKRPEVTCMCWKAGL